MATKQAKRPGPVVHVLTNTQRDYFAGGLVKGFGEWDKARTARDVAEGAMVAAGAVLVAFCGEMRKGNISLTPGAQGVRYAPDSIESHIKAGLAKLFKAEATVTRYMRMAVLMVNDGATVDAAYRATESAGRKAAKAKGKKGKPGPKADTPHNAAPKTGVSTVIDGKVKSHVLALRDGDEPKAHAIFAKFAESIGERLTPEQKTAIVTGMVRVWGIQSAVALQLDK